MSDAGQSTVTAEQVAAHIGAVTPEQVKDATEAAVALVDTYIAGATVPEAVHRSALLAVAADLWHRRDLHNGVMTFDTPDGVQPFRVHRDPLTPAYPLLRPYVSPAIA